MRLLVCATLVAALLIEAEVLGEQSITASTTATSHDFVVHSYQGGPAANRVVERCDKLRTELRQRWLGKDSGSPWQPRCTIVLHPSRASYLGAVGRGGGSTSGSSLIQFSQGRIQTRRIDLLVDGRGGLPALAHELTHVVLADRFGGRQPPRWLDEGVATMADSPEKRRLHDRDCREAIVGGTAMRVIELLGAAEFTSASQIPIFYGQSLSLVEFLASQAPPQRVVDFAEAARERGYDRALRECYGIEGVAALEHRWRNHLAATRPVGARPPVTLVTHQP